MQQNATRLFKKHSSRLIECNILMNEEMEYVQPSNHLKNGSKLVYLWTIERYEAIKEYKNTYIHTHTHIFPCFVDH